MTDNKTDVTIVGGGLSGLAAAVKLASAGLRVAVIEKGPRLGGRCYSFVDRETGDTVDNGQHLLIGAYHALREYLGIIGTEHLVSEGSALRLSMFHPEKGFSDLKFSPFPQPFHLLGILNFSLMPFKDKFNLVKCGKDLFRGNQELARDLSDQSIEEWLDGHDQSRDARRSFWHPLAVAIMNESPGRAAALPFVRSLRTAFTGKRSDSSLMIPLVGQTELYSVKAYEYLTHRNSRVILNADADAIGTRNGHLTKIHIRGGNWLSSPYFIFSVPPDSLFRILPDELKRRDLFSKISGFQHSPIISFNLWFDKEFMEYDHLGVIGKDIQWIFNRRRLMKKPGSTSYITAVISAASRYVNMPKDLLLEMALGDLHEIFPESRKSKLIRSVIIKEKKATLSPLVQTEKLRPAASTGIPNMFLAGDWTDTGFPATIEGAVMSGFKAAEHLLR